jgi:hypothetical protein
MAVWWVYWILNHYHYGSQNYGVCRILGLRTSKWLCVIVTSVLMTGPWLLHVKWWWWPWFALIVFDFNHWLVDIGLSSRVSQRWCLFLAAVAALGCIGFAWKVPRIDHIDTWFVPWIIKLRWGIGIAHFLYSRWVWKLSDPQVRATISRDLGMV